MTETASIVALGRKWGWKREHTSKALIRRKVSGKSKRQDKPEGTIVVRVSGAIPARDHASNNGVPSSGTAKIA